MQEIKANLSSRLKRVHCGDAKVCLGLEVYRGIAKRRLNLTQYSYLSKVLQGFTTINSKFCQSPMEEEISDVHLGVKEFFSTAHRQAIGSFMYLMICAGPDIVFAGSRLSQFSGNSYNLTLDLREKRFQVSE